MAGYIITINHIIVYKILFFRNGLSMNGPPKSQKSATFPEAKLSA
jgi:hypothetical protein